MDAPTVEERLATLEAKEEFRDGIHARLAKLEEDLAVVRSHVTNHLPAQLKLLWQLVIGLYVAFGAAVFSALFRR
jgi:tetrahydromethanopterin S-methyltransferase subunit G